MELGLRNLREVFREQPQEAEHLVCSTSPTSSLGTHTAGQEGHNPREMRPEASRIETLLAVTILARSVLRVVTVIAPPLDDLFCSSGYPRKEEWNSEK